MQDQPVLSGADAPGDVVLIGAGGHARVVYDALLCTNPACTVVVRDDAAALDGSPFFSTRIRVPALPDSGVPAWPVHVAIGANAVRARLSTRARAGGARLLTIVHPAARSGLGTVLGDGSFLAAGSVVGPCVRIGAGCIVNHGAVVDHDCWLGDWVHVAPNVTLGGGVQIGEDCLIGAGAVVLPGRRIGAGCTVGAGAVVVHDLSAGTTVTGIPAKVLVTR